MIFDVFRWRFYLVAEDAMRFPKGKAGNVLRGVLGFGLGELAYARVFRPSLEGRGPSGFADPPRPFVLRAAHLDGLSFESGESFHFDVNVFDGSLRMSDFAEAFARVARHGIGAARAPARLERAAQLEPVRVSLDPGEDPVRRITVEFVTPTELKAAGARVQPEFGALFARARDRISTLVSLYGDGTLDIDFKSMGERAAAISLAACDIRQVSIERRSSRTGQVHGIGGFVGVAEYDGDLTEFAPYVRAAEWTGVGRQTVWGKGQIVTHCYTTASR